MKKDTHPTYYPEATVTCACGNEFTIGSTEEEINVEMCSACHPFYTGVEKVVDTAGRVEKFKARQKRAAEQSKEESDQAKQEEEIEPDEEEDGFEAAKKKLKDKQ